MDPKVGDLIPLTHPTCNLGRCGVYINEARLSAIAGVHPLVILDYDAVSFNELVACLIRFQSVGFSVLEE